MATLTEFNGIATLLRDPHAGWVKELWQEMETRCGFIGNQRAYPPHFTWQVVEKYDLVQLQPIVEALAWATAPFTVRSSGLGVFTGRNPVLYIQLVKDAHLLRLHQQVWEHASCCAIRPVKYYNPDHWMPHITLAIGDLKPKDLTCALDFLPSENFDWEIPVDNFALFAPLPADKPPEMLNFSMRGRSDE